MYIIKESGTVINSHTQDKCYMSSLIHQLMYIQLCFPVIFVIVKNIVITINKLTHFLVLKVHFILYQLFGILCLYLRHIH